MRQPNTNFERRLRFRKFIEGGAFVGFLLAVIIGVVGLGVLLLQIALDGVPWLSWELISNYPSRHPEEAGLRAAILGTAWMMLLIAAFTIPAGIGAALYLEEYASKNPFTRLVEISISNLAGVPSIVYGLLGLALFVEWMNLGRSILAGALTLTLLVLPIVIIASREAIRAVPGTYREAAYALGATQWEVMKGVVIPSALPGMLTGVILALSRAIGEAAPVIAIAALVFITFDPSGPMDRFTVLPIQIFNWVSKPQEEFNGLAAAGIIVLLAILLSMNAIAVILRNRYQTRAGE